jgi:hypothetical protein
MRSFGRKLKITELYEENGIKFYRKLMVEDHSLSVKQKKLSKVEENISHTAEELETYKKVARELEEKWREPIIIIKGRLFPMREKLILIGW